MEAAYLIIPPHSAGKSAAAAVEAQTIRALQSQEFPMLSHTDARRQLAPRAAPFEAEDIQIMQRA